MAVSHLTPVQEIAKSIGEFYLKKNNGNYVETAEEIFRIQIIRIELEQGEPCPHCGVPTVVVAITSPRIGALIGKRGNNVDALQRHLGKKVKLIEDNVTEWLTPRDPSLDYYPHSPE